MITEGDPGHEVQIKLRAKERLRSRKIQLPSHEQEEYYRQPEFQAKGPATVHVEADSADGSEGTLPVERRRQDAPLSRSTRPKHAADKARTDPQQGLRRHSQRLQEQRQNPSLHQMALSAKVSSKRMVQ